MVYAGIDYGLERTGLAVSDPSERLVFPVATYVLHDYRNRSELLDALAGTIQERGCGACVFGLPLKDGAETEMSRIVRNASKRLQRRTALPLFFFDETLSSEEALQDLRVCRVPVSKRKAVLDQQAAVRILETFLQARRDAAVHEFCV